VRAVLTEFLREVRTAGVPVSLAESIDALRAAATVGVERERLRDGLAAAIVKDEADRPAFDDAFDRFFATEAIERRKRKGARPSGAAGIGRRGEVTSRAGPARDPTDEPPRASPAVREPRRNHAAPERARSVERRRRRGVLLAKPFRALDPLEAEELVAFAEDLARRFRGRLRRRSRAARRPGRLDFRRTLRRSVGHGGVPLELELRRRRPGRIDVVALCDVSGSMDLYSRFLLQFLFALQNVFGRVETFIFSTRLTRVSEYLRGRSYRQVLRRLTDVRDWSGGTRIGESLAQFNREWPHLVDRRTIVIVLSDGWDTGEPDVLATELMRIKRRAARVIWLNPLLGNPSYEPLTRGMAAALPLIDDFAAGHNLAALRDLAGKLHI
jgi:hypothetical protein